MTRLSALPYLDYLRTEHWQALAKKARQRAGYRCQLCNQNGVLHVHHRSYQNRGRKGELKDLIALCETCHRRFHHITGGNF
ncbi:MAG: HNH endonuclease [Desulfobacterales bacterium]|nr:HNH endonuclease [Desulfobacterales bacterium]